MVASLVFPAYKLVIWARKRARGAYLFALFMPMIAVQPVPPPTFENLEKAKKQKRQKDNESGDPPNEEEASDAVLMQKLGVHYREARLEDAHAICGVIQDSITELCVDDHNHDQRILSAWLANKNDVNIKGWLRQAGQHTYVAERGAVLYGVGQISSAGEIKLCYVAPAAIGQGVGKGLLTCMLQQAYAYGISKIELASTRTALDFYRRYGFEPAGKACDNAAGPSCYPMRLDLRRDHVLL